MKSVVVFNNKGGVGKTTLLCNLAAYLSIKDNKRVLIVDADPQCNASIYLFPPEIIDEVYSKSSNKTINDIITPLKKGKGHIKKEDIPIMKNQNFNVDVLIGDPKLALSEDFLSKDWFEGKNGEPRGLLTTFIFKDLAYKLEEKYDYIIYDVGPSLGAINRTVLLSCDYFIIPMSSDIFSLKAIENISVSVSEWIEGIKMGLKLYQKSYGEHFSIDERSLEPNIKFLGYVHQQYTAKTYDGTRRAVRAYDSIIKKMPDIINKKLLNFYSPLDTNFLHLGEITSLHSLVPLSQNANKPIFSLQGKDGVVGAHFKKVSEFEEIIKGICDNTIRNISEYDKLG